MLNHPLKIGDQVELVRTVTEGLVEQFVQLTGDNNPVHTDAQFATQLGLPGRVVHGMLSASFFSTVIGTLLPGPGALWLSQSIQFLEPVYIGDVLRITVSVESISGSTGILALGLNAHNQIGRLVIRGKANVNLLTPKTREQDIQSIEQDISDRAGAILNQSEPQTKGDLPTETRKPVALVTGASRGIGAAIARRLARESFVVGVNYYQSKQQAENLVSMIKIEGGQGIALWADVRDPNAVSNMIAELNGQWGDIQVLVNNAGGSIFPTDFARTEWSEVQAHLDTQILGAFNCIQAVVPGMLAKGKGQIINISSIFAQSLPPPKLTGYVVAKYGMLGLTRSLAVEYGPKGITVNAILPGVTNTDLNKHLSERQRLVFAAQSPLRRIAEPEDVAEVVTFLTGTQGRFITGAFLPVSGGYGL